MTWRVTVARAKAWCLLIHADASLSLTWRAIITRPYNLGVLDIDTNIFRTVATTGAAASGGSKYRGAAAVGTRVRLCRLNR